VKEIIVAERYAKAMIDVIKGSNVDKIIAELKQLSTTIAGSDELKRIFYNPSIAIKFKENLLSQLFARFKSDDAVRKFVYLILNKNRIKILDKIIYALENLSDKFTNRARIRVKTALKLDEKEIETLKKRFADITKKDVLLDVYVEPELIGGIIARIGSTVYDGSIKNQLKTMYRKL
jgi:F-type H+-transporting ATPase subunit delta